ncbi:hypothetical protein Patl1_35692 [Pistacia atlantica]|nr:hypothetical protein Patl1_35692 [Pistacia atlantica]
MEFSVSPAAIIAMMYGGLIDGNVAEFVFDKEGFGHKCMQITDAVVAAYILNATLVIPKLDQKSYWKDTSGFGEIFDVDWFISFLSRDAEIIKQLPIKRGKVLTPHNMRVPRKCSPKFYESHVLPVLNKKHARLHHLFFFLACIQLTKFDYRLSNNLDSDMQKLRCRVNYHALRFTDSILETGKLLVERMRMKSKHFIALHLRAELGAIRKRWKSLHVSNLDRERRNGRCPLTQRKLVDARALGFGSDAHLYVASGEVYGGEETLAPLKAMFPNLHSKETLASKIELEMFSSFSSRMAALDFIVCDVFVTYNNGNMARILAGRRRYFGHKPTIRPNAKKPNRLFMDRNNMRWEEFASRVRTHQIGFMGEPNEGKPGRGEFNKNPTSWICEDSEFKVRQLLTSRNQTLDNNHKAREDHSSEKEQDWFEMDYGENGHPNHKKEFST